jgi:hypothetical protein
VNESIETILLLQAVWAGRGGLETQNATKLETFAWWRRAGTGKCNPPVSIGTRPAEKGSKRTLLRPPRLGAL